MKTEDIDKIIGMPDIDREWARFEQEVIDRKPRRTSWTRVAAIVALMFSLGAVAAGVFLFENSNPRISVEETVTTDSIQPQATAAQPETFVFDNVEMQEVVATLGSYYKVEPVFENEEARHVRLYFKVEKNKSIQQVVELLNHFSKVRITLRDNKLIIK